MSDHTPDPPQPTFPTYERFTEALLAKLESDGYGPIGERLPVAGKELDMMKLDGLLKAEGKETRVVCVLHADRFAREQIRYMSDQFHNSLALEKNALEDDPTKVRGTCLFVFEGRPAATEVEFLMTQARLGMPWAKMITASWAVDLENRTVQKPGRAHRPFEDGYLLDCVR